MKLRIIILLLILSTLISGQVSIDFLSESLNGRPSKVFCTDNNVFVSAGSTVMIFDSTLNHINDIRLDYKPLGLFVKDSVLMVAFPAVGIGFYSIANLEIPVELSIIELSGEPKEVIARGDTVFVASGPGGVHVIEISNPESPQYIGNITGIDNAVDLQQMGNSLIVADQFWGIRIFNINSDQFYETGNYPLATTRSIKLQNNYLFSAGSGLTILDVSNENEPQLIHHYYEEFWMYSCFSVEVYQSLMFVHHYFSFYSIFDIFDITDLNDIQLVGGQNMGYSYDEYDKMHVANHRVAYLDINEIFYKDLSDPANPALIGEYNTGGMIYDIDVPEDTSFSTVMITTGGGGLRMVDFSDPVYPIETDYYIGNWQTNNDHFYSLAIDQQTLPIGGIELVKVYVGFYGYEPYYGGIGQIFLTSEGEAYEGISATFDWIDPEILLIQNDVGYINLLGDLDIIEVTANQMNVLSEIDENVIDLVREGEYLYAISANRFSVFEVQDLSNPVQINSIDLLSSPRCIVKSESYAFVGTTDRIVVIDVSDLSQIEVVSEFPLSAPVPDIIVWNGYPVIANAEEGIKAFKLLPDQNLEQVADYYTGENAIKLSIQQNILFAGYTSGDLKLLSLNETECIPGDTNEDGEINVIDITLTVDCILNNPDNCPCADLNSDGAVDVNDIVLMVEIILNE